ncbi:hypothetical protein FOA52_012558 [Chlamydomonas sp. UWO 241]|nr:hypothetical protein FOA52_012558 [Chlamydomonas sp. UWO 241]
MCLALAALSAELAAQGKGKVLLVMPAAADAAAGPEGPLTLVLALADAEPMQAATRVLRVSGRKGSVAATARGLVGALTEPMRSPSRGAATSGVSGVSGVQMEAVGASAAHVAVNALLAARSKLQAGHALDVSFRIDARTAPWEKSTAADADAVADVAGPAAAATAGATPAATPAAATPNGPVDVLALRVYQRALPPMSVDLADFVQTDVWPLQGRRGTDGAARSLADVLSSLLRERPSVLIPVRSSSELGIALGGLARAASRAASQRVGSLVALLSREEGPPSAADAAHAAPTAAAAAAAAAPGDIFPLLLTVQKLPGASMRTSTMGPARGRVGPKSSAAGLASAMSAELATRGYWSVSLDDVSADGLAAVVMDAALRVVPMLAHRGTSLGIMPEMVPAFVGRAGGKSNTAKGAIADAADAADAAANADVGDGQAAGGSKPKAPSKQAVVMHMLEYGGAVQELLRARLKAIEYAVTDAEQLQALTKTTVLRNASTSGASGQLTLRPFLDDANVLCLAVEAPAPPAPPAAAAATASSEQLEETSAAPASSTASSQQPTVVYSSAVNAEEPGSETGAVAGSGAAEADAGAKTAPKAAGRGDRSSSAVRGGDGAPTDGVLFIGKESDVSVVARSIGWQVMKAVRSARKQPSDAPKPLVVLRAGCGAALLRACTALAMVQPRLQHEMGFRVVALPAVKSVREDRRTFTVVEWALYPEGDVLPPAKSAH